MRIALIDDEKAVRETIRTILLHYYTDAEIKEAQSVATGIELISSFDPQLIFLDVEMGDGTGFDLLTRLETINCPVAFVTAHDHYAIKAFKFNALDYILKPVDPKEIKSVLDRLQQANIEVDDSGLKKEAAERNIERIVLSDHSNVHLIMVANIVLCQAVGNYTHFFLADGRELVISKTLKHYDNLLEGNDFIRVHQSYLINLAHLERYDKREGGEAVMNNGQTVPVSSRKKDILLDTLKKYKS